MLFGLDGVEIGLIIVFLCLFGGILSGFPVAFAIGGAGVVSFAIIAALDSAGLLVHQAIDTRSDAFDALVASGVRPDAISIFRYPDLPRIAQPVFERGWEMALDRNLSFIANRINERVLAGASIETLLAVLMFVMMGITLERSKIANDLLTTMARVFGPLPGGLAVSVVVVGAFLAASTGIVGATVVTMGLLSLPTMLRAGYSPQIATGVIAASGTLGQIIPPSIVIVLLGTLAGDLYSVAQENRAQLAGCSDALTYLGEPAVVSVGTLFQAALLPGILLALLYAAYAFGYALIYPSRAPAVQLGAGAGGEATSPGEKFTWFLGVPVALLAGVMLLSSLGLVGSQSLSVDSFTDRGETASLRTDVGPDCKESMIALHGQSAWDRAVAEQQAIDAAGGVEESVRLSPEQIEERRLQKAADAPPIGTGVATLMVMLGLTLALARGVAPAASPAPLLLGGLGIVLGLLVDTVLIAPAASPGLTVLLLAIPLAMALYGTSHAAMRLARNELVRVVFPPLVLIVAVLGSILGGITNPTPAAALGAGGAIMLAAYRKLRDQDRSPKIILMATLAVVIAILVGINFDLRIGDDVGFENWLAFLVAYAAYLYALFGLLFSAWVLYTGGGLTPVVRETAKVTSMVFTILIGSQVLNLVVISFGGEEYIQDFLDSFDNEVKVFLVVMLVLFILGFVLDFLEIIYIVVPIVGPVIYGGAFDPKWVTIMIAVNLQTSFLTPPFGFALFYLRGVAPPSVTTGHIYAGVLPFVAIQVLGLAILWFFPEIVTIVPQLLRG
jgi:TRAP-type mannitol/chloroaromatic compound transport system permease large subunit